MVAKQGDEVVLVTPAGETTVIGSSNGPTRGLSYASNGSLLAALEWSGTIADITGNGWNLDPDGGATYLFGDLNDRIWYSGGNLGRAVLDDELGAFMTTLLDEPMGAGGVWYDEARGLLFYTSQTFTDGQPNGATQIKRLPIDAASGDPGDPAVVIGVATACAPEQPTCYNNHGGLAMDACGHLYTVSIESGVTQLYRVELDAAGEAVAPKVPLATIAGSYSNAVFATGPGWNATDLYLAGPSPAWDAGTLFRVDVGVPGAPYAVPP